VVPQLPSRLAVENLRIFPARNVACVTTPDGFLWLPLKTEDVPSLGWPHFSFDVGLANLAVPPGPGVVRFFDGKTLRYARGRFLRYRQTLQRKLGMVRRSKGHESPRVRRENHRVSRHVVGTVATHGGVLHVEKLLGILDRTKKTRKVNRMLHAKPFAQLLGFIRYKAALAGVQVVEEDPRRISRQSPETGPLSLQGVDYREPRRLERGA